MKKKFYKFIVLGLFAIMTASCNSKSLPDLSGKWVGQVKFKTMLPADIQNPDGPDCGAMYTTQKRELTLSSKEEGKYTESVETRIEKFEYNTSKPDYLDEDLLRSAADAVLVFEGKYNMKGKYLEFVPASVKLKDDTVMPYADFVEYNETAADFAGHREVTVSDDVSSMSLGSLDYKKAE